MALQPGQQLPTIVQTAQLIALAAEHFGQELPEVGIVVHHPDVQSGAGFSTHTFTTHTITTHTITIHIISTQTGTT